VGTAIAKRRRPSVVILDGAFGSHLAHPNAERFTGGIFRTAAQRVVAERLDHLDVTADGGAYRVRVTRLGGPDPFRYAMFVEQRGSRRPLLDAYERFGLSAREIEVLSLIVDGASNRQIGEALCIVPGTVQDHVRSICAKCAAKRRGDLLARVFGVHES
jgi:DNA-binding CsgD family transcriptional regulator